MIYILCEDDIGSHTYTFYAFTDSEWKAKSILRRDLEHKGSLFVYDKEVNSTNIMDCINQAESEPFVVQKYENNNLVTEIYVKGELIDKYIGELKRS